MRIRELFLSRKEIPGLDLAAIVSHVLALSRERILMEPERLLDGAETARIARLVDERLRGKPLAYLTNRKEFFSESFYVDERVLIPRPETELLVEEALRIVGEKGGDVRVLDMGTGSGIIGILLAKAHARHVLCVDISPGALDVARRNARSLGLGAGIDFVASDLFAAVKNGRVFDLICANLPYVAECEWDGLMADVKAFEPRRALVGGRDGTELYQRYIGEIVPHLARGGYMLCEIGGGGQAAVLDAPLRKAGLDVAMLRDLAGLERVIRGSWKSLS
ncbi:MAG: peptide chain release factor N(5)-glutamine methyltransferase [Syntrophorhabdales bacterium]